MYLPCCFKLKNQVKIHRSFHFYFTRKPRSCKYKTRDYRVWQKEGGTPITASPEFFRGKKKSEIRGFFEHAVDSLKQEPGEDRPISAVVHMDEKTPHMYVSLTQKDKAFPMKHEASGERLLLYGKTEMLHHPAAMPSQLEIKKYTLLTYVRNCAILYFDISQKRGASMPRKQRCRWIEGYPDHWEFSPEELSHKEPVVMTLDEFETIRLLDREGLTQEQCAEKMGIARTTVTAIYESARRKVADALVDGKQLLIRGGNYRLNDQGTKNIIQKGTGNMRIAVTYENGEIFQHFGHTEQFKLYDVEDGKIVAEQIVPTNGSGHGALAGFLKAAQADALICGGIGMGAQNALAEAGIRLYGGVTGSADAAAKALAEGTLQYDPDAKCDHHGHHHGEGHDCGHHHGEGHVCGHHHGEGLDCGHQEGDEGCRRHHGE